MNIHKLSKTLPCSEEDLLMESIVCSRPVLGCISSVSPLGPGGLSRTRSLQECPADL